jgi:hypothetical protein
VVREGTELVDARIGSERVELPIGEVSQWLKERL